MALEFLNDTPQRAFRKLERDLLLVNPEAQLRPYKGMTPRALGEEIVKLEAQRKAIMAESTYGSWLTDDSYVELELTKDAVGFLKEYKEGKRDEEVLVPGYTYYRRVQQFGNDLRGLRCYFRESAIPHWVPWQIDLSVAKAMEVMRHGSEDDFRRIYVEMANGRYDSLQRISIEHITESDSDALKAIGEYCDGRWEGPWPWEEPSPYTLRETIEERQDMNLQTVNEMQTQFTKLMAKLDEEQMDKYEVISSAEEMAATIEKMVEQIARLGGEGIIKLKNNMLVSMGEEAASQIEDKFLEPIRQSANALGMLQKTILDTVASLKGADEGMGGAPSGPIGEPAGPGGELGSPMDAMGTDPMGDDPMGGDLDMDGDDGLAAGLADASLDGSNDGERPMKDM